MRAPKADAEFPQEVLDHGEFESFAVFPLQMGSVPSRFLFPGKGLGREGGQKKPCRLGLGSDFLIPRYFVMALFFKNPHSQTYTSEYTNRSPVSG